MCNEGYRALSVILRVRPEVRDRPCPIGDHMTALQRALVWGLEDTACLLLDYGLDTVNFLENLGGQDKERAAKVWESIWTQRLRRSQGQRRDYLSLIA